MVKPVPLTFTKTWVSVPVLVSVTETAAGLAPAHHLDASGGTALRGLGGGRTGRDQQHGGGRGHEYRAGQQAESGKAWVHGGGSSVSADATRCRTCVC